MGCIERLRSDEHKQRDYQFDQIVGSSPALESVLAEIERVAPTDSTVLILGQTGTGKEHQLWCVRQCRSEGAL